MKVEFRTAVAVAALSLAFGPVSAQEDLSRAINASSALDWFEQAVAAAEDDGASASWGSANAIGEDGFEIIDLTIIPPEDEEGDPITVDRVLVSEVDWRAAAADTTPMFVDLLVEGFSLNLASYPDSEDAVAVLGEQLQGDFAVAYRLEDSVLNIERISADFMDRGAMELALALGGITPDLFDNPQMGMMTTSINSARFTYTDAGLMANVIEASAEEEGLGASEFVLQIVADIEELAAMVSSDRARENFAALIRFIEDYENPAGEISVTIAPNSPVNPMVMMMTPDPDAITELLAIDVTYP